MPSQRDRVLGKLREAGSYGITTSEIRATLFIANPSQRVNELRDQGHTIQASPERLRSKALLRRLARLIWAPHPRA